MKTIAQEHGVHPVQVGQWKKEILERAGTLFEGKRGPKAVNEYSEPERLYGEIGKLKMELDCSKKVRVGPVATRRTWIEPEAAMPMVRQCELAGVSRSTVYAQRVPQADSEFDLTLLRLIDEQYTRRPFTAVARWLRSWRRASTGLIACNG